MAIACAVGQFAIPGYSTLGEALVTDTNGAVAFWGPGGTQYHADGRRIGRELLTGLQGESRLGDCVRQALTGNSTTEVIYHGNAVYNLLGDPATALVTPDTAVQPVQTPSTLGYDEWRRLTFAPLQEALSGEQDDPNGDGVNNYLAYALDLDPLSEGGGFGILKLEQGDRLRLHLHKRAGAAVAWRIEACSDLAAADWQDVTADIESVETTATDDTMSTDILSLTPSAHANAPVFLRAFAR